LSAPLIDLTDDVATKVQAVYSADAPDALRITAWKWMRESRQAAMIRP
jgi:hypothetical protein